MLLQMMPQRTTPHLRQPHVSEDQAPQELLEEIVTHAEFWTTFAMLA